MDQGSNGLQLTIASNSAFAAEISNFVERFSGSRTQRAKRLFIFWAPAYASSRRCPPATAGICAMACSANAVIVNEGLTPGLAGIAEPSQTSRFW